MAKQFDEFQKLKIKETCKAIQDMTYSYLNPETKKPTEVPAKHYEKILSTQIEETIEERVQLEILNTIYRQILNLKAEYGKDFYRSLICIEMGIKPNDMSIVQRISLEHTFLYIEELMKEEKKGFYFLREEIINQFKESISDMDLHADVLSGHEDETKDKSLN